MRSPKRGEESRTGRASWYAYYAGFSTTFVEDALRYVDAPSHRRLLDPWNGSGTTTQVGTAMGFESLGFDLNPAMVLVAKARLLDATVQPSLTSLLNEIVEKAARIEHYDPAEPLNAWFTPQTSGVIRRFDVALHALLINRCLYYPLITQPTLKHVSSLAAFFYVAIFRVMRELLTTFRTTNPTWLREPKPEERISLAEKCLCNMLRTQIEAMAINFDTVSPPTRPPCIPTVDRAASAKLPIPNGTVDAVIASPPYCTRIDYVRKTGPELALLGAKPVDMEDLRDQMIGTPTISQTQPKPTAKWGRTCLNLLDRISQHKAYASKSYYWKTYAQYFGSLNQSLVEITRTVRPGGLCFLVVQDSYYKDVHIDLAKVTTEVTECLGWTQMSRSDFPTTRTIVGLNSKAVKNGNPKRVIETVLGLRKR